APPTLSRFEALYTVQMAQNSTLAAARVDLVPGIDSEEVEEVLVRIKEALAESFHEAGQVFLDVTDRSAREAQESPAATGERGGA
ncbi:hypothetical protein ACFV23_49950, partial [Streptomyces sp. NPDC059627]